MASGSFQYWSKHARHLLKDRPQRQEVQIAKVKLPGHLVIRIANIAPPNDGGRVIDDQRLLCMRFWMRAGPKTCLIGRVQ